MSFGPPADALSAPSLEAAGARSRPRPRTRRLLGSAAIVALTFAAYGPALTGEFVLSDHVVVTRNPLLTAPDGLRRIWLVGERGQYQPLAYTTYWLEWRLWGDRPLPYHLLNVGLHAANAVCLCVLLARLGLRGALVAALIYALHPVNVEAVAWIYQRKTVLSTLFYLLTLLALARFDDGRGWRWYAAGLALFAGALLSKTATVVLPAVLVLYWWWRRRAWPARVVAAYVPFIVLAAGMSVVTVWFEHRNFDLSGPAYQSSLAERFARAGWIIWFYLDKLLLPQNLIFWYPRWSVDPAAVFSYVPHAVMLGVLAVLVCKRRGGGRAALLGLGYYVIALLPVLGFFDIAYHRWSFVADHFQYLALLGPIALGVHGASLAVEKVARRLTAARRNVCALSGGALGVLVVGACGFLTVQRAAIYHDVETICADTLRRRPDCWLAHSNLGRHLLLEKENRTEEDRLRGVAHLKRAHELDPTDVPTLVTLGSACRELHRLDEALEYLRCAAALDPRNAVIHFNLGNLHRQRNESDAAIAAYRNAVQFDPHMAVAHLRLGETLCRSGRAQEGIGYLREAARLNPGDPRAAAYLRQIETATRRAATTRAVAP